jgi:hypothetical protein
LHRNCADVVHVAVPGEPMHEGRLPAGHGPGARGERVAPGDPMAGAAAHWQARTESLLALERDHAAQCLRVRYEDLVASPATAAGIVSFLGLDRRPDLDWPGSVESGPEVRHQDAALLAARIGSPLLERINGLHAELHYPALGRAPARY